MQTYTLNRQTAAQQSRDLGLRLLTPNQAGLNEKTFEFSAESSTNDMVRAAHRGAQQIAQDVRARGLDPKDVQVMVSADSRGRAAVEDAIRSQGMKPVYLERAQDDFGVESSFLRQAQNTPAASRAMVDPAAVKSVVDLNSPSETVKAREDALLTLRQSANASEIRAKVSDYVSAVEQEFDRHGAPENGKAAVMPAGLPPSMSTLVESKLQERGITPLHETKERSGLEGAEVSSLLTSANAALGAEQRGLDAMRKALGAEGKPYSDSLLRETVGPQELQLLGVLGGKSQGAAAQELVEQHARALKSGYTDSIASSENDKYKSDSYESKHEFPSGVPRDAVIMVWVGNKSNVIAGLGGTSADMARGMDRVHDFLSAKGFDTSKSEIRSAFDRKTLERMGREGFDTKNFDATYSALTATAQAVGVGKPTGLDALHTQQRLESSKLGPDVKVLSDGKSLGTLGDMREKVAELARSEALALPGRDSAAADSTKDLGKELGQEAAGGRASAWDAAFNASRSAGGAGAQAGSGQDRTAGAEDSRGVSLTDARAQESAERSEEKQAKVEKEKELVMER